jgi:hypothetical protein
MTARRRTTIHPRALAVAAATAAAIAGCGSDSPAPTTAAGTAPAPAGAMRGASSHEGSVEATIARVRPYLATFRRPPQAPPPGVVPQANVDVLGADRHRARLAMQRPDVSVYLVPARDSVCLQTSTRRAGNCFRVEDAIRGTASSVMCSPNLPPGQIDLAGIIPDGARSVTVHREGGATLRVPVTGNVFVYSIPFGSPVPLTMSWTSGGKRYETLAGIDPDEAKEPCTGEGAGAAA